MNNKKTENKVKVLGYCRVSTNMQSEEGTSLDFQKEQIETYCKNNNLDLVSTFSEAISGSIYPRKRPLLAHILREIDYGNVEGVVVYKLDRLSRSIKDTIELLAELSSKKKCFYEIKNNLSNQGALGSFTLHLFSALAQLERSMIQERVNEIIKYRRDRNLLLGGVPFGKKVFPTEDNDSILIDDEEELRTIKMIIELRNTMIVKKNKKGIERKVNMPFNQICNALIAEQRKNKEGQVKWWASSVKRIYQKNSSKDGL
jgi:site-specific DNA recombinase